jgi:galactoside O-acetyltransferase
MQAWEEEVHSGRLYCCRGAEFQAAQNVTMELLWEFNQTRPSEQARRKALLQAYFAEAGEDLYIEPPFHGAWGKNTHWGRNCYANSNVTFVDDGEIFIGDNCLLAPNVVITATGHALDPELRKRYIQFSMPVVLEENVWIGANATVLPGVRIGKNSVIGAGSVVTRDVPPDSLAAGNPCRVLRPIDARDRERYFRGRTVSPGEYDALLDVYTLESTNE